MVSWDQLLLSASPKMEQWWGAGKCSQIFAQTFERVQWLKERNLTISGWGNSLGNTGLFVNIILSKKKKKRRELAAKSFWRLSFQVQKFSLVTYFKKRETERERNHSFEAWQKQGSLSLFLARNSQNHDPLLFDFSIVNIKVNHEGRRDVPKRHPSGGREC